VRNYWCLCAMKEYEIFIRVLPFQVGICSFRGQASAKSFGSGTR